MDRTRALVAAALCAAAVVYLASSRESVTAAARQPLKADAGPAYVATFIDLMPPNTASGTRAIQQYVADTKRDAGVVRIEALAQEGRENHLVIYEVWQTRKAFDAHEALAHTKTFKTTMYPLMGAPFDQRVHHRVP
jgi:quinol monooxygenase YgiN